MRTPLLATLLLATACAHHAHQMGGGAAQGAMETLLAAPPEGEPTFARRIGEDTASGALNELSSPEGLDHLSRIVEATVTRSFQAALLAPPGHEPPGGGHAHARFGRPPPRSWVEHIAGDSAAAMGSAIALEIQHALGPDGHGPLAESLSATASRVSGSAVQGARGELPSLFPGCENGDRRCLEAGVRSLGRAAATGFMEGILGSAGWSWPLVALAFVLGLLVAVVARGTWRLLRRGRPLEPHRAQP